MNKKANIALSLLSVTFFIAGTLSPGMLLADENKLANIQSGGITWNTPANYATAELSINGTGSFYKLFENGERPEFQAQDNDGNLMPDGHYSYQLTLTPQAVADDIAALDEAREAGNEAEYTRLSHLLQDGSSYSYYEESGEFLIEDRLIKEFDMEREQEQARIAYEASRASLPTEMAEQ